MDAPTITAVCALMISVVATVSTIWSSSQQRKHMRLSVKPIATFPIADFENHVGVYMANKGLGPMKITKLIVSNDKGTIYPKLISHMPKLEDGIQWTSFYDTLDGGTLEQGKEHTLILLDGHPDNMNYTISRDKIRQALKNLTLRVEYQDLYGTEMEPVERSLSFFGRHSANSI